MIYDNGVEEPTDHEEIGLHGFYFNFFDEYEEEDVIEGSSEFPYLLILIKLWPVDFITRLNRINQKVDEENGKVLNKGNVRYRKVCQFPSNDYWKNIGCLVSAPTFGLGGVKAVGEGRVFKAKWKEEE